MQDVHSKQSLRAALQARRAAMTEEERGAASRAIRDVVLDLPEVEMASSIAAYVSAGDEPDTRKLIFALWKRGTYVLLPKVLPGHRLDWASYEGPDSLVAGRYGLLEPTEPPRGVDAVRSADVVLVPGLALDRSGARLGRGGGYYDRALHGIGPAILTMGMVYDHELVDELPAEPHDVRMRAAVTPSHGLLRLPAAPYGKHR